MDKHLFTIGIEEEYQIVDPETRKLVSHMQQILDSGKIFMKEHIKPEMHQSVVEVGTNICKNIEEARSEVTKLRSDIAALAKENGYRIAAAGTHPFTHWNEVQITDNPRYKQIVDEMQEAARANLIFGLHVHIGVETREIGIQIMNAVRYFLPHIFALSTNSPFWLGRNTGFKSYRVKVFDKFPRTGIPDYYSSVAEFDDYINLLIKTHCIDDGKKLWYDVRLHPYFNTLEFRICDIPMRIDETICLAAIMQAVVVKLYRLLRMNLGFRIYGSALINENKWRAARYGIEGKLIDFGKREEVDFKILVMELLAFINDVVDDLGSRDEVNYVMKILQNGTGADRQLAKWDGTQEGFKKVVDYIIEETHIGLEKKNIL
jgi:glutamate---cysteine ligase / carboxylate-amine ligase